MEAVAEMSEQEQKAPRKRRPFEPKKLSERHKEVLRRWVAGQRTNAIARAVSITPNHVANIVRSKLGQEYIEKLSAKREREATKLGVGDRLTRMAEKVADKYEDVLEDPDGVSEREFFATCRDVLDRAGYSRTAKFESFGMVAVLGPEQLAEINELGQQLLSDERDVIDLDPTDMEEEDKQ